MITERTLCRQVLEHMSFDGDVAVVTRTTFVRPCVGVIVFVDTSFGVAMGQGKARCNDGDAYDPIEGKRIAKARAIRAIADDQQSRKVVLRYAREIGYMVGNIILA